MKLHGDNHGFEGMLPEKRIAMKIKSSAKMFEILSSGIYKDKILAVIREYVCNAFDAHVDAGKRDVPFIVRLPNRLDPTFSVTDEGTGVNPEFIGEIFWTYGESSKTNNNETIGALGLGSKSAFAYTKSSFIVRNRWNGREYTYFCFINENGEPEGSPVGDEETTEKNGITVEFAVRPEDIGAFHERFARLFKYWANVKPIIKGIETEDAFSPDPVKVIEGDKWYLETRDSAGDRRNALAIMGNVQYPIESESIPNLPAELKIIANNPFVITFPLGALGFASSRESLSYDEYTNKALIERLEEVRAELATSFHERVFAASTDHLSFYYNFYKTFNEFKKVVHVQVRPSWDNSAEEETNKTFTQLLLGKSHDSALNFKGRNFEVKDLIVGRYDMVRELYQTYGMYHATNRGRASSRFYLEPVSRLTFTTTREMDSKEIYESGSYKIDAGRKVIDAHDWRAPYTSPRAVNLTNFDRALLVIDDLTVTTRNQFRLNMSHGKLTFVFNDVGTAGRDRFKAVIEKNHLPATQLIYVEFNPKTHTQDQALVDLEQQIAETANGAQLVMLSALPDLRAPIVKAKVDKDCIKLKFLDVVRVLQNDVSVGYDFALQINQVKGVTNKGEVDKVMSVEELKQRAAVPFMVKRRVQKKYFDDVGSYTQAQTDMKTLSLASHFGLLDDAWVQMTKTKEEKVVKADGTVEIISKPVTYSAMPILIITEGQHDWLKKKGVKLVSITSMINKIMEIDEAEKFTDTIRRVMTLTHVHHLKGLYESMRYTQQLPEVDNWIGSTSLLKSLVAEYKQQRHNPSYALAFGKYQLLMSVKRSYADYETEAEQIEETINARYPMLELVPFNMTREEPKLAKLLHYVDQIDQLMAQAVQAAQAAVDEEEELAVA